MLEKFASITVIVAALAFIGSAPTLADHADIIVSQVWSRATPKGAKGLTRLSKSGPLAPEGRR